MYLQGGSAVYEAGFLNGFTYLQVFSVFILSECDLAEIYFTNITGFMSYITVLGILM